MVEKLVVGTIWTVVTLRVAIVVTGIVAVVVTLRPIVE